MNALQSAASHCRTWLPGQKSLDSPLSCQGQQTAQWRLAAQPPSMHMMMQVHLSTAGTVPASLHQLGDNCSQLGGGDALELAVLQHSFLIFLLHGVICIIAGHCLEISILTCNVSTI